MQLVLDRIKPYRQRMILGQSFKFLEVILELIVPLLIAKLVDQGIATSNKNIIIKYTILSLILAVSGMLSAFVCQYQASIVSQSYGTSLRNDLFQHILELSEENVNQFGRASLTTRITSDIQVLQQALAMLVRLVPRTPFICIGSIIMVAFINPRFIILFLIAVLIFTIILFLLTSIIVPLVKKAQEHTDRLANRMLELLSGIRVIRAVERSDEKEKQYHWTNEDLSKLLVKIGRYSSLLNPLTMLALNLIGVVLIWFAGGQVSIGNLQGGDIIALLNYLTMLLIALTVLSNLVLLYSRAYASALRVNEVLASKTRMLDKKDLSNYQLASKEKPSETILEFCQVDFSYPHSSKLLFQDLSFALPKGKSLSIIGPTGSGKSTLAYLLERRFTLKGGKITIFGKNINEFSEAELLDTVQIVPQTSSLFSGTLRESLTLGLKNVSDVDIWEALSLAQAKDFVSSNHLGLKQRIERGGKNFSGGQRQRLCIARALLHQAKIYIFDDSFSALDLATNAALQKAIKESEQLQDTTFIIISQRISTVRRSDLILLVDNGEKAGLGSHQELLATNLLYQEIYESQTEVRDSELDFLSSEVSYEQD